MASDFETTCTAISDLLTVNVTGMGAVTVHKLVPWDPAELVADGDRHLAVWPVADTPEVTEPLTLDSLNAVQTYRVLVWENAGVESSRQVLDEQAASDFLQLQNDTRRMFHPFRTFANTWKVRYRGTAFPERPSTVRWFEMEITVDAALEFAGL